MRAPWFILRQMALASQSTQSCFRRQVRQVDRSEFDHAENRRSVDANEITLRPRDCGIMPGASLQAVSEGRKQVLISAHFAIASPSVC